MFTRAVVPQRSFSDIGTAISSFGGKGWGQGGCPDGAPVFVVPWAPSDIKHTWWVRRLWQGWEGPQSLPWVSLKQRALLCAQMHTSGFCSKTGSTIWAENQAPLCFRKHVEGAGSLPNPAKGPLTHQVC